MKPRGPTGALGVGVLVLATVLAGCVSGPSAEFTVPADAGPIARQEDVDDPAEIRVHVAGESPDGAPIPGAAVVFFVEKGSSIEIPEPPEPPEPPDPGPPPSHGAPDAGHGHGQAHGGEDDPEYGYGPVYDFHFGSWTQYEVLAAGRTDANGTVRGLLAPGRTVHVAVGGLDGWTTELRSHVVTGSAGSTSNLVVPLLRSRLAVTVDDAMPLSVSARKATLGFAEEAYHTTELRFHGDGDVHRAYLERLDSLTVNLTWTNTPTEYGDLYAGLSAGDDEPFVTGDDDTQMPAQGESVEHLHVPDREIDEVRPRLDADGLSVAAVTDSAAASLSGLPYRFDGVARFEASDIAIRS